MNKEDHDLLIEIHTGFKSLAENLKTWQAIHVADDERRFVKLEKAQEFTTRMIFLAMGGIAIIAFATKLFFK